MRLIVGLGNPGQQYVWTPHNLGFHVVSRLVERTSQQPRHTGTRWPSLTNYIELFRRRNAFRHDYFTANSYVWRRVIDGEDVILAEPQTFMNLSGTAVLRLMREFSVTPKELVVILDDVALGWGTLRIRLKGSAGGHNGLRSILERVGTDEFVRVRIGVEPSFRVGDVAAYVLQPMTNAWRQTAAAVIDFAADAAVSVVREGPLLAMAKFNNKFIPI